MAALKKAPERATTMGVKTRIGSLLDWDREVDGFRAISTVICVQVSKDGREVEVAPFVGSMIRKWVPREQVSYATVD